MKPDPLRRLVILAGFGIGLAAILAGCAVRQIQPETVTPPIVGSGGGGK